jgi:hypothetical protein
MPATVSYLGMTVKEAKGNFFDKDKVIAAVGKANARNAQRIGGFTRTTMQRMMRRRKKAAPPGQPPNAHEGKIRDLIFFAFDAGTKSTVVGPVKLGKSEALTLLDKGGHVAVNGIYKRNGEFISLGSMNSRGRLAAIKAGKVIRQFVPFPARPFVKPTKKILADNIARLWRDTVKA